MEQFLNKFLVDSPKKSLNGFLKKYLEKVCEEASGRMYERIFERFFFIEIPLKNPEEKFSIYFVWRIFKIIPGGVSEQTNRSLPEIIHGKNHEGIPERTHLDFLWFPGSISEEKIGEGLFVKALVDWKSESLR